MSTVQLNLTEAEYKTVINSLQYIKGELEYFLIVKASNNDEYNQDLKKIYTKELIVIRRLLKELQE